MRSNSLRAKPRTLIRKEFYFPGVKVVKHTNKISLDMFHFSKYFLKTRL